MKNALVLYCSLLTLFTSCFTPAHVPHTQNVPLFTDKEQLKINVAANTRSLDVQGAYSPVNHLGVMANLQLNHFKIMPEIAVGGFYCFDDTYMVELYGGFGASRLKYSKEHDPDPEDFNDIKEQKYVADIRSTQLFIQPNVGFRYFETRTLALSVKICLWNYSKYELKEEERDFSNPGKYKLRSEIIIANPANKLMFEPALTYRRGEDRWNFMLQAGYAIPVAGAENSVNPYIYVYAFARIGFTYTIDFNEHRTQKGKNSPYDRNYINSKYR